jgi:dTDP-4-amino-4,6-dideoxygalactose transaminase
LYDTYTQKLKNISGLVLPEVKKNVYNNYQYFVIRVEREKFGISRDEVHENLKKFNVFTRKYFSPLCSEYEYYRRLPSASKANLPTANKIVDEVLCMPLYGTLFVQDIEKICEIVTGFQK